ncbi:hypothetical protein B0H14DRAFT_1450147 [Mycena olivaceomarginata]|nr:hypothetical protein B0H14DRAFT_1450147 [Mycena olivaceomarginata]
MRFSSSFTPRRSALPHLKSNHGRSSKTKPSKTAKSEVDVFSAEDPMVEYLHRTVRFIMLRGNHLYYSQDGTRPDTRFYVHHLVQDSGSLVGRCARIFCVSRETESEGDVRNFIGPYALKLYNADCESDCFKDDLIQLARDGQAKNVLLPTWEWYYSDTLSARGFPPEVVKTYTDAQAAVPSVTSNWQEVFAQSDLKRLLVQSANYEFVKAFIDFVEDSQEEGGASSGTERQTARAKGGGEEGVSDEEPDDLTPFMMVVPSGAQGTANPRLIHLHPCYILNRSSQVISNRMRCPLLRAGVRNLAASHGLALHAQYTRYESELF